MNLPRLAPAILFLALAGGGARLADARTRTPRHKPAKSKAEDVKPAPAEETKPAPPEETKPAAEATPAPAPRPAEAPAAAPAEKPKAAGPTVESLRAEYDDLRDQLFRSRARRETLENALLSTQVLPAIRWRGGRHHQVKRAELRFDGVRLWESADGIASDKAIALSPKSAPPGPHVVGVRVEVRSRDNPDLGYVSDQSFAVALPEGKKTTVEITVDEDGSAPSYNPDIAIEVRSK
jgi:hypothetical protein